ncbi:MAG: WecB/TagA/CpsF family glycosyltransferase [Clostridia bacterium]|nr:WecB/TagA/CpsF family glycosyltransferase [Clostridia bacterium]
MNIIERNLTLGAVGYNACTQDELIGYIQNYPVDRACYVSFLGAPHISIAERSPAAKEAYQNATIVAVDGMPVVKVAKKLDIVCERCGGPDIMERILKEGVEKGYTHYFYGESPEVLVKLEARCRERFPGIQIAGSFAPPYRPLTEEEEATVLAELREKKPDFIWVSLGSPKQDEWMEKHASLLVGSKLMGVGAAFKFLAGTVKRAPVCWRKAGLEWLYRIFKEPHLLWERYLKFSFGFLRARKKAVKEYRARQEEPEAAEEPVTLQ